MALRKRRAAKWRVWNKGLAVGQKDAFTPAQVKRIRQVLTDRGIPVLRNLALFSVAIDTMLQGPELLNLTVKDVALANGMISLNHRGCAHQEATGPMRLVQGDSKGTWKMDCRVWQKAHGLYFPWPRRRTSTSDDRPANAPSAEILGCRGGVRSQ